MQSNTRTTRTHPFWEYPRHPMITHTIDLCHDDVIKWKHCPRYWPFVQGIHRSPVNSPQKGQWRGALMFSFICAWINGWVNNGEASDLRRHHAHYDVPVISHPKSNHDRVRVTNFFFKNGKISKFGILQRKFTHNTPSWYNVLIRNEMGPASIVLWKLQSGDDSVQRRADRRIWWNQYTLLQLRWTGNIFIYFCSISDAYDKSIIFIIFYSLGHTDCREMLCLVWRGSHSVGIWLGMLGLITT